MSTVCELPAPWEGPLTIAIGGLWALGFDNAERLYCVSASGLGVLDPSTAEKLARDREDRYHEELERVRGIGPSADQWIAVAGRGGGIQTRYELPTRTDDRWQVAVAAPRVGGAVMLVHPMGQRTRVASVEPLYAFGFSASGRFLVLGESHTLTIFRRR